MIKKKHDFMHSTLHFAVDEINVPECIMHLDLVVVQHAWHHDVLSEHLICISVKMQMFTQLCHHHSVASTTPSDRLFALYASTI